MAPGQRTLWPVARGGGVGEVSPVSGFPRFEPL